jgi:hypothetical protein
MKITREIDVITIESQILDIYDWSRPKGSPITLWSGQWLTRFNQLVLIEIIQRRNNKEMEEGSKFSKGKIARTKKRT